MQRFRLCLTGSVILCLLAACNPSDRTPGVWLRGEAAEFPADWAFSDAYPEVAVEVATPYFVRHSVTIWCAQLDGTLYIGAAAPEEKNWPGWVDDDPNVRLLVGESIYSAELVDVDDPMVIEPLLQAYKVKYDLDSTGIFSEGTRYWRVAAPMGS